MDNREILGFGGWLPELLILAQYYLCDLGKFVTSNILIIGGGI